MKILVIIQHKNLKYTWTEKVEDNGRIKKSLNNAFKKALQALEQMLGV